MRSGLFPAARRGYAQSVQSDSEKTTLQICLLWLHPLVAGEFHRLLGDPEFQLVSLRADTDLRRDGAPKDASLYVVEADFRHGETEHLIASVFAFNPNARVMVMAEEFKEEHAFALLRLGTKGLLAYSEAADQLPRAVREVAAGGYWVPRAVLSRFVDFALLSAPPLRPVAKSVNLTPREREVLEDLLLNLSNKEIAKKRHISGRTAKFHVSNVLAKHGVRRRSDLLLLTFQERQSRADN
jgi:DNA-binding NarL/FixJ family response regulator